MYDKYMKKILFVCTGNICRSPLAEGIVRHRLAAAGLDIVVDSAGTERYHVGQPPDPRAIAVARSRGVDISRLRARQIGAEDLAACDLVLVADNTHLAAIRRRLAPGRADVSLLLEWCGVKQGGEVPDPYYGGPRDFEQVYALLDCATDGLLERLTNRARKRP